MLPPLRLLPPLGGLLVLLSGCPDPAAPAAVGTAPVATHAAPSPATEPPAPPRPDGAFPMPDPLPQEALPRAVARATPPRPGPAPLSFWLGGSGTQDGRFHYPRAVVTSPDGTVFIADKSGRIQKWSPNGKLLAVVRTPGIEQGKPTGLGMDAAGNLLVADTHYCRVLVYDQDLQLERHYGAQGSAPGRFMLITSVQAGAGGLHYTTDFGDNVARVQVFRADGTHLRSFGSFGRGKLQFRRPMNIAVDDARDRLYVADAVNHRIAVFTRTGVPKGFIGSRGRAPGQLDFPYDVKLDAKGRLWVAEFGNQRVSLFAQGKCIGVWGRPGRKVGGLNRPWGVALGPSGRLWVLDSGNDRVYALPQALVSLSR